MGKFCIIAFPLSPRPALRAAPGVAVAALAYPASRNSASAFATARASPLCGILLFVNETSRLLIVPVQERPGMFRVFTPDPPASGLSPNYGELTEADIRTLLAGKFEPSEIEAALRNAKAAQ